MIALSMQKSLEQRLPRGTPIIVGDSFGRPALRGAKLVVASKGPVKCMGKGRCAGDWCVGLAVFAEEPGSRRGDKEMGWRGGTTKICLTHLKDKDGELILPPPVVSVGRAALESRRAPRRNTEVQVSWEELAQAAQTEDWSNLIVLARELKRENDALRTKVIEAQDKLLDHIGAR